MKKRTILLRIGILSENLLSKLKQFMRVLKDLNFEQKKYKRSSLWVYRAVWNLRLRGWIEYLS